MAYARPSLRAHRRETLRLRDGSLRLAAVADTHGRPHPEARARLLALAPHHILHAGDVGDLAVLEELERVAPLSAVRGNIDTRAPDLPDVTTLEVLDGDARLVTILLLHIAVYGPKLRAEVAKLAREEGAQLVVCGHSHVPFIGRHGGITVFNPGSIGPRRFHLPIVFGMVEIDRARIDLRHVDCETGATWTP